MTSRFKFSNIGWNPRANCRIYKVSWGIAKICFGALLACRDQNMAFKRAKWIKPAIFMAIRGGRFMYRIVIHVGQWCSKYIGRREQWIIDDEGAAKSCKYRVKTAAVERLAPKRTIMVLVPTLLPPTACKQKVRGFPTLVMCVDWLSKIFWSLSFLIILYV